jgi:hypothetical protein
MNSVKLIAFIKLVVFFALSTIGGMNIFYIMVRGMINAPGLKWPFTQFFVYEPGLGFFQLIVLLLVALGLRFYLLFARNSPAKILLNRMAWAVLIVLLGIEGLIIADFEDLI